MNRKPLIVLKFGGSVLPAARGLRQAVHEIYRWRREGWRVLAVTSTFAGRTDELAGRCDQLELEPASPARAAVLGTGEIETSALLHAELERAGVPAFLVSPGAAGIVATGDPTDAAPVGLAGGRLPGIAAKHDVVVVPGYVATDREGRPVVLGRGGSDLTALFLAAELAARRCRLLKDVDGLYVSDPAGCSPPPERYVQAHYDDALATDGSILQHKAIRFASERGLEFELGGFNSDSVTRIGALETLIEPAPAARRPLRVGLLGHGTVGGGVARLLRDHPDRFELCGVSVRDAAKHPDLPQRSVWTRPTELARQDLDVVVETLGGTDEAATAVKAALHGGAHVVTANKSLLALLGPDLDALGGARGAVVLGAASVGGGLPLLENLDAWSDETVVELEGILCGTANFVLDKQDEGLALEDAIAQARRLGLAEADPSRDLDGRDAADKLAVIADRLGGPPLDVAAIPREDLRGGEHRPGRRQVARLLRTGDGWDASVQLVVPEADSPLRRARGRQNAVEVVFRSGRREFLLGDGAGRWPTAESVLADLLEIERRRGQRRLVPLARPAAANPGAWIGPVEARRRVG